MRLGMCNEARMCAAGSAQECHEDSKQTVEGSSRHQRELAHSSSSAAQWQEDQGHPARLPKASRVTLSPEDPKALGGAHRVPLTQVSDQTCYT